MMLPLPNLTNKDFQTLFEEAKNRIPALTKEWTDFNYHDTGITLLQLFAWLFEMQHYYADAIGEVHQYKYLKLLGYKPIAKNPAKTLVNLRGLEQQIILPRGIQFKADEVIFENEEPIHFIPNQIGCILKSDQYLDITEILTACDQSYETLWSTDRSNSLYIGFTNKIEKQKSLPLYIKVYEGEVKRNKFDEKTFKLASCKWEIYTESGWQEISEVQDDTNAFLRDGYIVLCPSCESAEMLLHENYGKLHYIRCVLVENTYDIWPKVSYIGLNVYELKQKHTLAVSFYLDATGEQQQVYELPHYLGVKGEITVAVQGEDQWTLWHNGEENASYHLHEKNELTREIYFDKQVYGKVPPKGEKNICIICYHKDFYNKKLLDKVEGYANQQIVLEEPQLYEEDFKAVVYIEAQGIQELIFCDKVENLHVYSDEACVYEITSKGGIHLGEGIYKKTGVKGLGQVMITDYVLTKGAGGNVKENKITQVVAEDTSLLKNFQVFNIEKGIEGKDEETIEEAINTFRKKFAKRQRAITYSDYEALVKETPGLMIDKVKAVSEAEFTESEAYSHKLYLIIKPHGKEERPGLSQIYKEMIKRHIENYRLLTTQIEIQSPSYLGIDVYGCLYIRKGYEGKDVYVAIKNMIDSMEGYRSFGDPIIFGTLFGQIETLESVAYIDNLSLEPIGYGGEKTLGGDIIIRPNVLTYLRNYHVELR